MAIRNWENLYTPESAQREAELMQEKIKSGEAKNYAEAEKLVENELKEIKRQLWIIGREMLGLYDKSRKEGWDEESANNIKVLTEKRNLLSEKLAQLLESKLFSFINSENKIRVLSAGIDHFMEESVLYFEFLDISKESSNDLANKLSEYNMKIFPSTNPFNKIKEGKIALNKEATEDEKEEFKKFVYIYQIY